MRILLPVCLLLSMAMLSACRQPKEGERSREGSTQKPNPAFQPTAVIPAEGALLHYDGLTLGMSTLDLSQIYNAPDGRGDGFYRGLQDYDDVQTHVIEFERPDETGPRRTLTLSFYRDQLYIVVDRIEGLSEEQSEDWKARLTELYGPEPEEILPGAQWSWGDPEGIQLVLTRDNSSSASMTANVVLEHKPTGEAVYNYLAEWEKRHPGFLEERRKAAEQQSGAG
ncbi:MAG: hypothetical protein R3F46_02265 [bacterium]